MKYNFLIKTAPFLSTSLLLILLSISNQKEYTKLRILIWNTPSLTLGSYLAISTGTGFALSYFITSTFARIKQSKSKQALKFKDDFEDKDKNEYDGNNTNISYENTLIERDIKDPSPTIDANFRIIGKQPNYNESFIRKNKIRYDESTQINDEYEVQTDENETINQTKSFSSDWNDDSFSIW